MFVGIFHLLNDSNSVTETMHFGAYNESCRINLILVRLIKINRQFTRSTNRINRSSLKRIIELHCLCYCYIPKNIRDTSWHVYVMRSCKTGVNILTHEIQTTIVFLRLWWLKIFLLTPSFTKNGQTAPEVPIFIIESMGDENSRIQLI
jgi:hypothetical protein